MTWAYLAAVVWGENLSAHERILLKNTIVEVALPKKLAGTPIGEANLSERHKLVLNTIRKNGGEERADGERTLCGISDPESTFEESDYRVVFGQEKDVDRFSEGSD